MSGFIFRKAHAEGAEGAYVTVSGQRGGTPRRYAVSRDGKALGWVYKVDVHHPEGTYHVWRSETLDGVEVPGRAPSTRRKAAERLVGAGPDGWMLTHHRAVGGSCHFGPFTTREEAHAWAEKNPQVKGVLIPLYRTVDWNR